MKGQLRGILIANYAWLLIVFILLFAAAIPAIPGTVLVKLPGPDDWNTTITNGTVNISSTAHVHNGGFFPFNNFYFVVKLYTENGSDLAVFESPKTNLLPGLWINVSVYFVLNKTALSTELVQALLFSKVTFASLLYFNTNYLFDFRIQAGIKGNLTVGPFVKDFQVHTNQTVIKANETGYELDVPYHINTTSILNGTTLNITGTISNNTALLGNFSSDVPLGGDYNGTFVVYLTKEAFDHLNTTADHLYLNVTMTLREYHWTVQLQYDWVPPQP